MKKIISYKNFHVDLEKAEEVAKNAVSMLERKVFPFNNPALLPDTLIPESIEKGSLEHSLLQFFGCNIDKGRDADKVWKALRNISDAVPLTDLHCLTEQELKKLLSEHLETINGNNYGDPVGTLHTNSGILRFKYPTQINSGHYSGDPRNIAFDSGELTTVEGTMGRLQEFKQFGPGVSALFVKNMVRNGFWSYDPSDIYIKVDRHVLRISEGTGVLVSEGKESRVDRWIKPLMESYREVTKVGEISAVELDDAFFGIGSSLCVVRDQNYCSTNCNLGCKNSSITKKQASYMTPGTDRRKGSAGQSSLF